jgi:4-hydroxy-tetrahydrodipicolinate reductase
MKIAVAGHTGRVGQELQYLIAQSKHQLTAGWDREGTCMLKQDESPAGTTAPPNLKTTHDEWIASEIDVVIDFSMPDNFPKLLDWCQTFQKPLVSGVTGLDEVTSSSLKEIMGSKFKLQAPLFWSSNMSLGIALLKQFIVMAKFFGPHDFFISETHHVHKVDSPSGTAISLARKLQSTFEVDKDIPIEAIRKEEVFGIHEVTLKSDNELVRIYHEAMNRRVFASGALRVAEWMESQPKEPGLYFMEDFISNVKNA